MKTIITKTELKKIHDIACSGWQSKIVEFTKRNPFGEDIEFSKKEIEEMISACTKEQLPIVKEIFEIKDITSEIKTLEEAINKLGDKDEEVELLKTMQDVNLPRHILAEQELVVIIKALNEGWKVNFDDYNQYKYYPWFYLGKNFRYYDCNYWNSSSISSARLCLKSSELAIYAGKQFTKTYKEYMNK